MFISMKWVIHIYFAMVVQSSVKSQLSNFFFKFSQIKYQNAIRKIGLQASNDFQALDDNLTMIFFHHKS